MIRTNIRIAGIEYSSTIDWYGKVAIVFFLSGCNFRCIYCHNYGLFRGSSGKPMSFEEIIKIIKDNSIVSNAIIFTGGEPTLQGDSLIQLCRRIKEEISDMPIMIDTNGSRPDILYKLMDEKLIDRVALDVKHRLRPNYYEDIVRVNSNYYVDKIFVSMKWAKHYGIPLEIRTTVVPGVNDDPLVIDDIVRIIKNYVDDFILQQCIMEYCSDVGLRDLKSVEYREMKMLGQLAKRYLPRVYIKTLENGFEEITNCLLLLTQ